jgi:hypothetical protein
MNQNVLTCKTHQSQPTYLECIQLTAAPEACNTRAATSGMLYHVTAAGDETTRPWLNKVVRLPPAAAPTPKAGLLRKRPFIYVYDMPPAYNTRMLQYRLFRWVPCHSVPCSCQLAEWRLTCVQPTRLAPHRWRICQSPSGETLFCHIDPVKNRKFAIRRAHPLYKRWYQPTYASQAAT